MKLTIQNKTIGAGSPVFIIAELSANHNQSFELAIKTIEAAKQCGADAVKLQTYTADTITLDSDQSDFVVPQGTLWSGKKLYDLYKEAYTPWEWQPKLKEIAESLGLICFSSPFDHSAVDFLENMNAPAYKIASFEITDIPLIRYVASKQKPVIISTGIASLNDIEKAVNACREMGNNQIALLKCTSAYPAPLEEMNLRQIPTLAKTFGTVAGLSDHTMIEATPVAAVALGASIIEKHLIVDRSLGGPDSAFSLEPAEFKGMVDAVRDVEKALGSAAYTVTGKMAAGRAFSRSLYASADIKKGEAFTPSNVKSVRPGYGLHPQYYDELIGKKAERNIKKGEPLKFSDLK